MDVALEFTNLIIAQRGSEVHPRTITVSNKMLQTLTNIIRYRKPLGVYLSNWARVGPSRARSSE